jgi:hypothetical protein
MHLAATEGYYQLETLEERTFTAEEDQGSLTRIEPVS